MIEVRIALFGCAVKREVERMVGLFIEDAAVTFTDDSTASFQDERNQTNTNSKHNLSSDSAPIKICLNVSVETKHVHCRGEMYVSAGQTFQFDAVREFDGMEVSNLLRESDGLTSRETYVRKRAKQVVLHVVHELLTQYTESGQPWGILTGVRPLKLVHQMRERGLLPTAIAEELRTAYQIAEDRIQLLLEIADCQLQVVPDLYRLQNQVSVYIGIPFCPTHCAYCTFPAYSMTEKATYVNDFLAAMDLEFQHLGKWLKEHGLPVTSVYIGGGTPTSLRGPELAQMFESMYRELPGSESWRELNVEAGRPDTITPDRVKVMREYGVNRISVNPQTFKASTLKEIGRGHTPDIVDHRYHYVRDAGFENINMDMIIGLPGETIEDVANTRRRIAALNPDSVTIHTMSFKRTAVVREEKSRFAIPTRETVQTMMKESKAWAREMGYHPYYVYRQTDILGNQENIGFAKPGKESVYNISIMEERQTIVGIGGGAVTKLIRSDGKPLGRFANPREPKSYVETIQSVIERKDAALRQVLQL